MTQIENEEADLNTKLTELDAFISSGVFSSLAVKDQYLLREQYAYMLMYITVLRERISRLRKPV